MKKGVVLLGVLLALFLLTSCASDGTVLSKSFPDSAKVFRVNDLGTIEVKGYETKGQPMHWLFVHCDHWSGCYMRCQGPLNACKSIAAKSGLDVNYIQTQ